jgi:hypothetical protein
MVRPMPRGCSMQPYQRGKDGQRANRHHLVTAACGAAVARPARFELTTSAFGGQEKLFSAAYRKLLVATKLL